MTVVSRGPDQVEANAIAPPVRRAFEPGHEKTVEIRVHIALTTGE
jgi:hypothetical protein